MYKFYKMIRNVRFCLLRCVLVSLFLLSLLPTFESQQGTKVRGTCRSKECNEAAKNLQDSIDLEANPCDDFYQYACGDWPKYHKNIIYPFPISSTALRVIQNHHEILEFFNQTNNPENPRSIYKARLLYHICLNQKAYNRTESLKTILSSIGLPIVPSSTNENTDFDEATIIAKATKMAGIHPFFDTSVNVDPRDHRVNIISLSKPKSNLFDVDLMLTNKNRGKIESVTNTEFIRKVLKKMCEIGSSLCCTENDMVEELAQASRLLAYPDFLLFKHEAKIYSLMPSTLSLQYIQRISDDIADAVTDPCRPRFNWTRYIEEIFDDLKYVKLDLEHPSRIEIEVQDINYIRDIIRFIHTTEPEMIELMLWWKVVSTLLPYADFEIFRSLDSSSEAICKKLVTDSFGMAVSYMYLKKNEYNKAKAEIENMLPIITESYEKLFEQAIWMDKKTIERAITKVKSIKFLVAYPNATEFSKILDEKYGNVEITSYHFDTMVTMIQNQIKYNLNKLNQINYHTSQTWSSAPYPNSLNVLYEPTKNTLTIPAGLLGPPLHYNIMKAFIYGSMGTLVGRELVHGFDAYGSVYNEDGVLKFWWDHETYAKYVAKTKCFMETYANYNSSFQGIYLKGNSSITFLQDVADNVGFKAALLAYRSFKFEVGNEASLPNFEKFSAEQLFTLGFANNWCQIPTNITIEGTQFHEYSPAAVRVNGVLKNSREFSKIWNCPKGSNMNPSKKCSIW